MAEVNLIKFVGDNLFLVAVALVSGAMLIWRIPRSWQLTSSRPAPSRESSMSITSLSGPSPAKTAWPRRRKMSAISEE